MRWRFLLAAFLHLSEQVNARPPHAAPHTLHLDGGATALTFGL